MKKQKPNSVLYINEWWSDGNTEDEELCFDNSMRDCTQMEVEMDEWRQEYKKVKNAI